MTGSGEAKERILARALELFAAKGYDGVGVQELVEAAGITKPTLYYYFGSKEGVLHAVLDRHYAELNARVAAAAIYRPDPAHYERDVLPALVNVCEAYFSFASADALFYRLQLALALAPPESAGARAVRARNMVQYETMEAMMHDIAACHGNVRKHERRAAAVFIGVVNSYIVLFYNGNGALDAATARGAVRMFMHGLFA